MTGQRRNKQAIRRSRREWKSCCATLLSIITRCWRTCVARLLLRLIPVCLGLAYLSAPWLFEKKVYAPCTRDRRAPKPPFFLPADKIAYVEGVFDLRRRQMSQ